MVQIYKMVFFLSFKGLLNFWLIILYDSNYKFFLEGGELTFDWLLLLKLLLNIIFF